MRKLHSFLFLPNGFTTCNEFIIVDIFLSVEGPRCGSSYEGDVSHLTNHFPDWMLLKKSELVLKLTDCLMK